MFRFSILGAACVLASFSQSVRADQSQFEIAGSARIRGESKSNADFNDGVADYLNHTGSRFRVDMKFKPKEQVTVFFQPQFSKIWGEQEFVPTAVGANTAADSSGTTNDTGLDVHQAYVRLQSWETVALTFGRKELGYGDQLVLGGVGWHNVGRAFDMGLAAIKFESGSLDVILAKVRETNSTAAGAGDKDLSGLYSSHRLGDAIQNFDVYALISEDHSALSSTTAVGMRVKSPIGGFDYRAEATSETLKAGTATASATQVDVEVGYSVWPESKWRVAAEYFRAGESYDQLFPTGHKWLGYADLFSRRNIGGYRFGVSGRVLENLELALDYHDFRRVDTSAPAYKFSGAAYGAVGTDDAIATEIDLILGTQLAGGAAVEFGFAKCDPKGYLRDNGAKDAAQFAYASLTVAF